MMEFAPAKINLTLHVTGRRNDGYHLLDSLVAFVDVGDEISVQTSSELSLQITGPEAKGLDGNTDNLVLRAAKLFGDNRGAALTLQKNLPTSSGIGGGSADAAATLRLLAKHWQIPMPMAEKILGLGADVPVCLAGKTSRMRGIGECLEPVPLLPKMALVLFNPRQSISTPNVFKKLKKRDNPPMSDIPVGANFGAFCNWLAYQRNDMQSAAISLVPSISDALDALVKTGATLARMSGSGATCFGIYSDFDKAQKAADHLRINDRKCWVRAARVL